MFDSERLCGLICSQFEALHMIGQILAHYRILEKIGEEGMGIVYKALDTHLDRPVAINVLPPEKVADADRKRRFIQEAKVKPADR